MLTLTIDRSNFEGPEEAYLKLQKDRAVAELIKKLHRRGLVETREFFYAIEFHKNGGWVHYHVAVRGTGLVDKELLGQPLYPSSNPLAKLWKHGIISVSAPDDTEAFDPEHAMNYLTKYIAKQDVEPPSWILDRRGSNFRKFSTSRGLCEAVKSRKASKKKRKPYKQTTPRERAEACATTSRLMEVVKTETIAPGGEVISESRRYRFLHDVDLDFRFLKANRVYAETFDEQRAWVMMQLMLDNKVWSAEHLDVNLERWERGDAQLRATLAAEFEDRNIDWQTERVLRVDPEPLNPLGILDALPSSESLPKMYGPLPDPAGVCVHDPRPAAAVPF